MEEERKPNKSGGEKYEGIAAWLRWKSVTYILASTGKLELRQDLP
jgi:hypothetical protein